MQVKIIMVLLLKAMKDDVVKINYGDVVTTMRSFNAGKHHYDF